jgi:sec-independent protein translocase protein TatB
MTFGLTFEKLFVIAAIAVVLIGPQRLPEFAARLASLVKRVKTFIEDTKERVDESLGDEERETLDWTRLDPRQYDPRKIIRQAWDDADTEASPPAEAAADPAAPERDAAEA